MNLLKTNPKGYTHVFYRILFSITIILWLTIMAILCC
ncbi:hypothetical protein EMA8858_03823 [Emticicia aquatica]|uniref:Uncharacterized protein n=1 Tax=Emticicia aquatica TaxID=1681835 RepID=A0ABM9AVI5_9BACT|nr:hypothetical protein EMA8858_03823 [Emticicia aquatica]